jgi:hypothetical protein
MAALVSVAACDDDPLDPDDPNEFGEVAVTVATTGYEPDFAEEYEVAFEGGGAEAVDVNGEVLLVGIPAGSTTIDLSGAPAHCTVAPDPATVTVTAGETEEVTFTVTCAAITGGITPAFTLTGDAADIDPLVTLTVVNETTADTNDFEVNPSAPEELLHFTEGPHTVLVDLEGIQANCTVAEPDTIPVAVTLGATAEAAFGLDCVPHVGDLTVNIATTGTNPDNAYTLTIGDAEPVNVGNGASEFNGVRVGNVDVVLGDIAENCTVADESQTAVIAFGEMTTVDFAVTCE